MQAAPALAHVPPAALAQDAVIGELGRAALGAVPLDRRPLRGQVTLLGSWKRMHRDYVRGGVAAGQRIV